VAISQTDQARAYRQAIGMVHETRARLAAQGRANDPIVIGNLARRLLANNTAVPGANFAAYQAVARRAVNTEFFVRQMEANPAFAPGATALPQSPTLGLGNERFRYQVVVTGTDSRGHTSSTPGEVRSDRPLSLSEIEASVQSGVGYRRSDRYATNPTFQDLSGGALPPVIRLISAHRTY
jgi:hypothetical protein